jgi:hypothetical protein
MDFEFLSTQALPPATRREIEEFLHRQDCSHPFQFIEWMWARDQASDGAFCAMLRERGELVWFAHCGVNHPASRLFHSVRSLMVFRGPVCDDPAITLEGLRRLVQESQRRGFAFLDIAPDWLEHLAQNLAPALEADGWQPSPGTRTSLRLDLHQTEDQLLASFRKTTRYEIRRSEREGVIVRSARDEQDVEAFRKLFFAMAEKKNFSPGEAGHLLQVSRWLLAAPQRGALFLAYKDSNLLGGIMVIRTALRCWYVQGATAKGDRLSAGHLLQWEAIRWAKKLGCAQYDFLGFQEGIDSGTFLFKKGFGGTVVPFSPSYRYSLNRRLCSFIDFIAKARSSVRLSA